MKKTFLLPLLIAVFTFSLSAQTVDELISQADNFALKEFNNQKALEVLLRAEKIDGKNWEVLWRISRSYVDIAEHLPDKTDKQKEDQLAMYQKSLDYANKAINIAPNKSRSTRPAASWAGRSSCISPMPAARPPNRRKRPCA